MARTFDTAGSSRLAVVSQLLLLLLLLSSSDWAAGHPAAAAAAAEHSLQFHPAESPADCPAARSLLVDIPGQPADSPIRLELIESSSQFLHTDALATSPTPVRICFYQGHVDGDTEQIAVATKTGNLFSAHFYYNGDAFEIAEQDSSRNRYTAVLIPPIKEPRTCGLSKKPAEAPAEAATRAGIRPEKLHRSKRAVMLDTNSALPPTDRKYIRLILVGDQFYYQRRADSNMTVAVNRLWEIGNYINALYKQLGVNVITVYTEVWTTDPYVTTSAKNGTADANSTEMLTKFMDYKVSSLNSRPHSAAHLVSGLKMTGSDVGLAHLGRLCHTFLGGGVNSDLDSKAINVAVTVAHELGHNLGLVHDEDEKGCTCPDPQCIMAAIGSDTNPLKWSNCSVFRYTDYSVDNGLGYCMSDPPKDADVNRTRATCGNRIVESGEDCDCGPAQWCNNTCCDALTCKFTPGSSCASGQCCNLTTCRPMSQGVVCRPRRRTCDLEEYCNGTSEWCPLFDDYLADGTECSAGKAYCESGRCQDRDTRCRTMFNGTIFFAAPAWYSAATLQDSSSNGYCSYQYAYNSTSTTSSYTYTGCSGDNQRCGTLYCISNSAIGNPIPAWKGATISDAKSFEGEINGSSVIAAFMQVDISSSGYRDPGLVPNGAECGLGKMCVNSQCITINTSSRCPDCNGRGVCAQSGMCFCDPGFAPPNCLLNGTGGSLLNHPPDTVTTTTTSTSTTTTTTTTPSTTTTLQAIPSTSTTTTTPSTTTTLQAIPGTTTVASPTLTSPVNGVSSSAFNQSQAASTTTVGAPPVNPTNLFPMTGTRLGCSLASVAMCSLISFLLATQM